MVRLALREEVRLFLLEFVDCVLARLFLVLLFLLVLSFFVVLLVLLFFLGSVAFARCVLCAAEGRACSEALAIGVQVRDVNSKAQSVIENVFIRATGQSPGNCRL